MAKQELPTVSAIIPTKKRHCQVQSLIANLGSQDYPAEKLEIILVDDGSDPPCQVGPTVRVIGHEQSQGTRNSGNEGTAAAAGEIIFILDDDMELL